MSMKKKDYELVAREVSRTLLYLADSNHGAELQRRGVKILAEELATEFKRNNPKFDRDKFLTACGVVE